VTSPISSAITTASVSHMWRPIMPLLAEGHIVVVPDLRGAGGSAKPAAG
jgi:pimeloyl-ACP methyl ester carboxylesterase